MKTKYTHVYAMIKTRKAMKFLLNSLPHHFEKDLIDQVSVYISLMLAQYGAEYVKDLEQKNIHKFCKGLDKDIPQIVYETLQKRKHSEGSGRDSMANMLLGRGW